MHRQTHRHAFTAMVFAILGWTALPLVGAVLAVLFARFARQDIDANSDVYVGHELAESARMIATVWLGLFAVALAALVAVLVAAYATG